MLLKNKVSWAEIYTYWKGKNKYLFSNSIQYEYTVFIINYKKMNTIIWISLDEEE